MNGRDLLNSIGEIDESIIEKNATPNIIKKRRFKIKFSFVAAVLVIMVVVSIAIMPLFTGDNSTKPPLSVVTHPFTTNQPSITVPEETIIPGITGPSIADFLDYATFHGTIKYLENAKKSLLAPGVSVRSEGFTVGGPSTAKLIPEFNISGIVVLAKATRELNAVYETLPLYEKDQQIGKYRVFEMVVIDPLESGLKGKFYYALHSTIDGDITKYDSLLLSLSHSSYGIDILKNNLNNSLESFDLIFSGYGQNLCSIIPFTNDIFDESFWKENSWTSEYRDIENILNMKFDENNKYYSILVKRESTIQDALDVLKIRYSQQFSSGPESYSQHEYRTEAAKAVMAYIEPFSNGVFYRGVYNYRRYVGGFPTNEWISIIGEDENISYSKFKFEDKDFENLIDIGTYIESLDLDAIKPPHIDNDESKRWYTYVTGAYVKTKEGVLPIVKINWEAYWQDGGCRYGMYDQLFLVLEKNGARIVSGEFVKQYGISISPTFPTYGDLEYGKSYELPT